MAKFNDPAVLKNVRIDMWIQQVVKNLDSLEKGLLLENYDEVRIGLKEQYRLIFVLRSAKQGKTVLQGWKTESSNSTGD